MSRRVSRRWQHRSSRSRDLPRRRRRADAQGPPGRAPGPRHPARDAPLRPLDARRLPFRAPGGLGRHGRIRVALGGDRVHGAARTRARVGSRAGARRARRSRARAVRPQRDLAREDARDARVPARVPGGGSAGVRPLLRAAGRDRARGRRSSPTSASARSARSCRRWPLRDDPERCSCRSSSSRSRSR